MSHPPAAKKPRLLGCSSFSLEQVLSEEQLLRFKIHHFESLPHKRGEFFELPPLKAHGHSWSMEVGGSPDSNEQTERVSLFLVWMSSDGTDPTVKLSLTYGAENEMGACKFTFTSELPAWGGSIGKREVILDPTSGFLDETGTLTVDVRLQIYREKKPVWFPPKHQPCHSVSQLWMSPELCADVMFSIDDEHIPAHKFVLADSASTLLDIVKDDSSGEAITISGVEVDVFKAMLQFVYTGKLPKLDFVDGGKIDAKALLVAADRFGCTGLKLRVESEVTAHALEKHNAAAWLLFADSRSCALLKEASVNMFVAHAATVMESAEWAQVEESKALLVELMRAQNLGISVSNENQNGDIHCMDVSSLRDRLQVAGLDVDGSREMLVSRLKNHVAENDDDEANSE